MGSELPEETRHRNCMNNDPRTSRTLFSPLRSHQSGVYDGYISNQIHLAALSVTILYESRGSNSPVNGIFSYAQLYQGQLVETHCFTCH